MNKQTIVNKAKEYFKTQPVLKAWLFGSYARGEQNENSDVDILVLLDAKALPLHVEAMLL